MRSRIPLIHLREHFITLMYGDNGPLSQYIEVKGGNDSCNLDDSVGVWIQPCHLHIDPNQSLVLFHGAPSLKSKLHRSES